MTPLIGVVIAVLAARLAPNLRAAIVSVLVPLAAATAVQTWDLGADWGSNPASTIQDPSYWVIQLIIFALITGLAVGLFSVRSRRAGRRGESLVRPAFSGRRGARFLLSATAAMTVALFAAAFVLYKTTTVHGHGAGNIPWTGVLGIVLGLVTLAGLAVASVATSRAAGGARDV